MTPVKVPTAPCADAAPGQDTAATSASAAKDGFDMLSLPRSLDDQLATVSVDVDDHVPHLELVASATTLGASNALPASHASVAVPLSAYPRRHSESIGPESVPPWLAHRDRLSA